MSKPFRMWQQKHKRQQSPRTTTTKRSCGSSLFPWQATLYTCAAIEKNTKETVETLFADELKDGSLVFKSIDISQSENEEIINKYEVTWSSLFITKWKNGKDSTENLTEYAFAKALSAPDTFKANVTQKIRQLLK